MATLVPLGTAATYGVLANTAVTNTGPTVVTGDLGVSPAGAVTGFNPPGTVTGTIHVNDAAAAQAQADLAIGYSNAFLQPVTATVATELGGTTLFPGVYNSASGTFGLNGTLTLDAQGDPNAVFIFKTNTTLISGAAGNVNLIGLAQSSHVFWQVGSSATLGAGSTLRGSILANTSITATTGAIVDGRLLALGAAVTLDTNAVTVPALTTCQVVVQPVVGPVVVGQPTSVSAVVTCNGLPVSGASVTFNGGAVPVTVTTNVAGVATGSLTFNTAGTATVTATVTAAGTACSCTGVVSAPITVPVTPQPSCQVVVQPVVGPVVVGQPTSVSAVVTCNGLPVSGASVTFNGGAVPVTVTTNVAGVATGSLTFNTAGTATVTATVTAAGTACSCTGVVSPPITVPVTPQPSCQVVVQPVVGPVVVGQPTSVSAVVTCNGLPVSGASVTFNGGAVPVTVTTNVAGVATGSLTFNTAGTATVTATVTAAGTACSCTGVVSPPITVPVTPQTSPLSASPACWRVNLPFPIPHLFVATLKATLTPAQAGVTVTFYVSGLPVGTAVTNASGVATLNNAGLSILQISASSYTAVATVGGTTVQATGSLTPCFPPA
ncbi:ice-binding family protein [Streptomyces sp. Isolate_219]|uniref:ice-binding family protein n=1 Tax=Streptomyces sp. Isolate_219 TaxID=2950110 RepID=UPI0021C9907E|nr:ice-binding family protein [Streptomyces sp. Isolate_219]MCR8575950.1 ice-binding family protein [Streptomyces sp. Isolate_219]